MTTCQSELTYSQLEAVFAEMPKKWFSKEKIDRADAIIFLTKAKYDLCHIDEVIEAYSEDFCEDYRKVFLQEDIEELATNWWKSDFYDSDFPVQSDPINIGYVQGNNYVNVDYDRVPLATSNGFVLQRSYEECDHSGTDGTVDCPDCGKQTMDFINEATEYLDYIKEG